MVFLPHYLLSIINYVFCIVKIFFNLFRVTLDILSVQGSIEHEWQKREPRAIWRGRDSRLERLKLVDIARANPDLFNASLTNFFFFRDKEAQYGPKQPHISFFKFFDVSFFTMFTSSFVVNKQKQNTNNKHYNFSVQIPGKCRWYSCSL